jgi:hypothetical protein
MFADVVCSSLVDDQLAHLGWPGSFWSKQIVLEIVPTACTLEQLVKDNLKETRKITNGFSHCVVLYKDIHETQKGAVLEQSTLPS